MDGSTTSADQPTDKLSDPPKPQDIDTNTKDTKSESLHTLHLILVISLLTISFILWLLIFVMNAKYKQVKLNDTWLNNSLIINWICFIFAFIGICVLVLSWKSKNFMIIFWVFNGLILLNSILYTIILVKFSQLNITRASLSEH